jgi:hypothetical protein
MCLLDDDDPTQIGVAYPLRPIGTPFGRSPGPDGVVIGAEDIGVSRVSGWLGKAATGDWGVVRRGKSELRRERDGVINDVPADDVYQVQDGDLLLLRGAERWYRLLLELPSVEPLDRGATVNVEPGSLFVQLDIRQRLTAAALAASRLAPDDFPDSTSTAALAALLGVDQSVIDGRIHRLKKAVLIQTGLVRSTRDQLADFIVEHGIVSADDLADLRRP